MLPQDNLHARPIGWSPEPEFNPITTLVLAIVQVALDDLGREFNDYHLVNPVAARRWLLQEAPDLLIAVGLERYVSQLLSMIQAVPEPEMYQLPLILEEVAR